MKEDKPIKRKITWENKISEAIKEKYKNGYKNPMLGRKRIDNISRNKRTFIGRIPWNKGKKGIRLSPKTEFKKGHISWRKGLTKETNEKIRKVGKKSSETKKRLFAEGKLKIWNKGIKGYSTSLKGRKCIFMTERNLKNNPMENIETKKRMIESNIRNGIYKRASERMKILNRNSDFRKKQFEGMNLKPNKSEQFLNQILQENFQNEFKFVGDGQIIFEGLCPDFINCNGKKLIIELFGEYHHNLLEVVERDKKRLEVYSKYGYRTLIIWSNELKDRHQLIEKIDNFLGDKNRG